MLVVGKFGRINFANAHRNAVYVVFGIINGTTNFVLTKMAVEGLSMEDALAEARRLSFAEFDAAESVLLRFVLVLV